MNKEVLGVVFVALALAGLLFSAQEQKQDTFDLWVAEHGFSWAPEHAAYRRAIFFKNLAAIEKHNADHDQTYTMSVNQFTALSQEEFEHIYLGAIPPVDEPIVEHD